VTITVNPIAAGFDLTVLGPPDAVRGQSRAFTFGVNGTPSGAVPYQLDWDGDLAIDETVTGVTGSVTLAHTYTDGGSYTIRVRATDTAGQAATATHTVSVTEIALQPDPVVPGQMMLVIGGSVGDDKIHIKPASDPNLLRVTIREKDYDIRIRETFGPPIDRIVVYAQAGNDDVHMATQLGIGAWLYGDAGDDRLKGDGGNDVLLGGEGDDLLVGGAGRDLLIGGVGSDRLVGNAGDDLLIAGSTAFDGEANALSAIMAEWTSARSYAQRIANLSGLSVAGSDGSMFGFRENGDYFLTMHGAGATVVDDNAHDVLTGSQGMDWFLFNTDGENRTQKDKATDLHAAEYAADLDWIFS
jgi:Ca2+-binding RTX toxin-like protein